MSFVRIPCTAEAIDCELRITGKKTRKKVRRIFIYKKRICDGWFLKLLDVAIT